jgi:hypothetical protein
MPLDALSISFLVLAAILAFLVYAAAQHRRRPGKERAFQYVPKAPQDWTEIAEAAHDTNPGRPYGAITEVLGSWLAVYSEARRGGPVLRSASKDKDLLSEIVGYIQWCRKELNVRPRYGGRIETLARRALESKKKRSRDTAVKELNSIIEGKIIPSARIHDFSKVLGTTPKEADEQFAERHYDRLGKVDEETFIEDYMDAVKSGYRGSPWGACYSEVSTASKWLIKRDMAEHEPRIKRAVKKGVPLEKVREAVVLHPFTEGHERATTSEDRKTAIKYGLRARREAQPFS